MGIRFPLKYKNLNSIGEEFRGTISKNISEGGVRFRSDRFISLACRLIVEFNIPAIQKPIRAISKIAWIKKLPVGDDYEVGNQFLEITRQDKEIIRSYINQQLENPSI
ncbi:MAG: PilZ domain-containing protein [Candidatus Omnitrophica bacterium]|nr:PilZ domain-containing protein [Candidatus Omnitrophota bacterium]